ncbi:hypothetical protein PIB30_018269 [Stylosanthes scabra]|uniref:Uncharacterized protein n=1 Tax=Stylosanthes scabra TaxID=79078 RepID=A0ABU6X652_9FABA|nr:hypothetical protein [Stylosanthes scabra]
MPLRESWVQIGKAPTKWSKCSEKEHINSAQLKEQNGGTNTTAPHRTDHPVLSCKKRKLCAPTVKVKTSRQANLKRKLCAPTVKIKTSRQANLTLRMVAYKVVGTTTTTPHSVSSLKKKLKLCAPIAKNKDIATSRLNKGIT